MAIDDGYTLDAYIAPSVVNGVELHKEYRLKFRPTGPQDYMAFQQNTRNQSDVNRFKSYVTAFKKKIVSLNCGGKELNPKLDETYADPQLMTTTVFYRLVSIVINSDERGDVDPNSKLPTVSDDPLEDPFSLPGEAVKESQGN